jgi:pantetheine-phosphate adenylyltransferase
MRRGIYPGTFDPITLGPLDLIARGSRIFDELNVAVAEDTGKDSLFSLDERTEMAKAITTEYPNVTIEKFSGLLVDYVRSHGAAAILRGIRTMSDFEYEFQMALMNRVFAPELETVFVMASLEYSFVSSRLIRQAGVVGGDISHFVPPAVEAALKKKWNRA